MFKKYLKKQEAAKKAAARSINNTNKFIVNTEKLLKDVEKC